MLLKESVTISIKNGPLKLAGISNQLIANPKKVNLNICGALMCP